MGAFSIWHILLVLVVILLVFGAGKLPRVMGDFAKGIKSFKAGMKEGAEPPPTTPTPPAGNVTDARATTEGSNTTTNTGEKV